MQGMGSYSLLHPLPISRDNINDDYNNRTRLGSSELRTGNFAKDTVGSEVRYN